MEKMSVYFKGKLVKIDENRRMHIELEDEKALERVKRGIQEGDWKPYYTYEDRTRVVIQAPKLFPLDELLRYNTWCGSRVNASAFMRADLKEERTYWNLVLASKLILNKSKLASMQTDKEIDE